MTEQKSNYYSRREKNGRELTYDSPEKLLAEAINYFKWCDQNPWIKRDVIRSGSRTGEIVEVPVPRPYTLEGLCVHIGISVNTFCEYEKDEALSPVTSHLREAIRLNLIEGTITGAYNIGVVSRILEYANKQEATDTEHNILIIESASPKTKENLEKLKERQYKLF